MKKIFLFLILMSLITTSCNDYVKNINLDPNSPSEADVDPNNMIQGVMLSNQFWANGIGTRLMMIWTNQATGSDRQYLVLNNWNNSISSDFNDAWSEAYTSTIGQAKLVAKKALKAENPNLAGVAQVLEANSIGMITALWGDVPFKEAGNYEDFPNPAYDSQVSVYAGVQKLLDDAITNLSNQNSGAIPSDKDIYYAGDASKWIALAHSLKARFYLHIKDYKNANIQAMLGINSASGDFKAKFGTSYQVSFNPYYSFLVYDRSGYMSADGAYAYALLNSSSSDYRGNAKTDESLRLSFDYINDHNYNNSPELNFYSKYDGWGPSDGKFGTESDMPLVTYGEMLLIEAEYQARTNGLSPAVNTYNTYRQLLSTGYSIGTNNDGYADFYGGVNNSSGKYQDYADADFNAGGMENTDNIDPVKAFLRELYQERYVYFIGHFESFNDLRRTNNIAGIKFKSGFSGMPERFLYPEDEIQSNSSTPSPIPGVTVKTSVNQ